jgi:VanZ family protein
MRTWIFAACSVIWMFMIFSLSSVPGSRLGPDDPLLDLIKKAGHFVIFGVLGSLYLYTLKGRRPLPETRITLFLLSLFLAAVYAASDEYHQSFTPGRHASAYDVVIDACGAMTFLAWFYTAKSGKHRRE